MLQGWVILLASLTYLGILFGIAYYGDHRADTGRSIIANPYIYALSMAVYATSWTYYGSVGRAAVSGIGFLPIYLGPTLMAALWWVVLRKMIRISKSYRITSIADFIGSRYGKSQLLAGIVTVIAVVGIVPYIALQLKAISSSLAILLGYPSVTAPAKLGGVPVFDDTTFLVALMLAAFTILFGTRHLEATERHEGMVAAIAFESLVKLVAFVSVGVFAAFVLYDGLPDLFRHAAAAPELNTLLAIGSDASSYGSWASLTVLSMLSILFLPRQFQVAVVENVNENHLNKAIWLFPLYLLAINVFVLPIALAGLMLFGPSGVDADTFVLTLPMAEKQQGLALLVFIGGLSAATGMVIVETIALSTMVCNDLVMPALLRIRMLGLAERHDLTGLLLGIRRGAIAVILLLGYAYFRVASDAYALVSIGLISFAAVAQFAPAMLGGMFWKGGTRLGAVSGLLAGFLIWTYTLLLPSFAKSGWLPLDFLDPGWFGTVLLKPLQLFGLQGLDEISHCMFWSMLFNVGLYIGVSLALKPSAIEHSQANLFVDVFRRPPRAGSQFWRGSTEVGKLLALVSRFLGPARAREAFAGYARDHGFASIDQLGASADLVHFAEILLAGAIGAASARVVVASVAEEESLGIDEVMNILDEASQVIAYSHQLEAKQRELEEATASLRAANERLQELDRLKDDFISTVTHELRTPLTSIRAFSEILHDNPALEAEERHRFLGLIIKESERLTRLINQVLDLAKLESGLAEWNSEELQVGDIVADAASATSALFKSRDIAFEARIEAPVPSVMADRDRLMQVLLNLLSNAVKFCEPGVGRVEVHVSSRGRQVRVDVRDNGPGISREHRRIIFEKFRQVGDTMRRKPAGTGLGLAICSQIVGHFGGRLWVESDPGRGSVFSFTLPAARTARRERSLASA